MGDYHPSKRRDGFEPFEPPPPSAEEIILPGSKDEAGQITDEIHLTEANVVNIEHTNLADHQADASSFKKELEEGTVDLGDGFLIHEEPVIVDRDMVSGDITRLTPITEIPGVDYHHGVMSQAPKLDLDGEPVVAEAKETLFPVSRDQRHKLVSIMAARLMKHYQKLPDSYPGFNPVRDGIPTLPAGSPEHLEPLPGTPLYPATASQVFEYLKDTVGQRAKFINKQRFGDGHSPDLRDLSIQIG